MKNIEFLEYSTEENLYNPGCVDIFLGKTEIKTVTGLHWFKALFCKRQYQKNERQATDWNAW